MTLSSHINADIVTRKLLKKNHKFSYEKRQEYIFDYDLDKVIPKYTIPDELADHELVYKAMNEELALDGNPTLNLALFVNTNAAPTQMRLLVDNATKNLSDNDEYPALIELQQRCVLMIANMWNAPLKKNEVGEDVNNAVGTATTGSLEAVMLGGLALKRRWQERRKKEGKLTGNPNILMALCAQVALEKFANYFDVENRLILISPELDHLINYKKIRENLDENTIGVFVIMGLTFTGAFEPVKHIADILDDYEKETGINVRIHVDGALGAFVAPFCYPSIEWDFRVPRVDLINTSGHKFGLTSVGLGWVIWKDMELLPKLLRFSLDYLGGVEELFNLNFSRPGFPVIMQYYNFLQLGKQGYTELFNACLLNARLLLDVLEALGYYRCLLVIHQDATDNTKKLYYTGTPAKDADTRNENFKPGLPVVAFTFSDQFKKDYPEIPQEMVSTLLRNKGIIVPNYRMPPDEHDTEVLRVVVRTLMLMLLLDKLIEDIIVVTETLMDGATQVRKIEKDENHSSQAHQDAIKNMLLAVTTGGIAKVKEEEKKLRGRGDEKKSTYRGTC